MRKPPCAYYGDVRWALSEGAQPDRVVPMLATLLLTGLVFSAEPTPGSDATPLIAAMSAEVLLPALSPSGQADFATVHPSTTWQITAAVDEAASTVGGTAVVTWRNDEAQAVPDLCLQLLANSPAFHGASIRVTDIRIDNHPIAGVPVTGGAYLRVPFASPLAPGKTVTLACAFVTTPSSKGGLYGLLSRTPTAWCLYAWHPEVALRNSGEWAVDAVQDHTDPTRTATAHELFTLDVPQDLQVVAGGMITQEKTTAGRTTLTIAAPFARNEVLVLGRGLVSSARTTNGVTVRSWHRAGLELGGQRVLDACASSITLYSERFGPYPFTELDAVAAPLGDEIGGMESTGLVIMDEKAYEGARYLDEKSGAEVLPIFMLMVCAAHETAHQWWYSAVGSDPYHDPWLDESLTNWTGNFWMEQQGGAGAGNLAFGMCLIEAGMGKRDDSLTKAIPAYPSFEAYGAIIYARGALFYQWLRRRMGDEQFFAFLRAWYSDQRWHVATPADWHATLARFATPEIISDTDHWLSGNGLTQTMLVDGSKPQKK